MALPDGARHILAGLLAAAGFLGMYFPLALVWWAALPAAAMVYFALLFAIPRRTPADEIMLSGRISEADVQAAAKALFDASKRLDQSAAQVPEDNRGEVVGMALNLRAIRQNVLADPNDYRSTRRFVTSFLPLVVQSVESYGELAGRAGAKHADRLGQMGDNIRGLARVIEQIEQATLENDFDALEVEMSALASQMNRGYIRT